MLFVFAAPVLVSAAVFGVTLAFWTARALGRRWDARLTRGVGPDAPLAEKDEDQTDTAAPGHRSMEKGIENLMAYDLDVYKARGRDREDDSWR